MSKNFLFIDDEPMYCKSLSKFAGNAGHKFDSAIGCEEAKAKAVGKEFDAIFIDLNMPDFDGEETLTELKKLGVKCKNYILMSGDKFNEDEVKEKGFDYYIEKPVKEKDFLACIEKIK